MGSLQTIDFVVFLIYFVIVASYGYWIYNKKKKTPTAPYILGRSEYIDTSIPFKL